MAKDPAFLFYHHDFLIGTEFMSHEQVGCYIRILCHMADKGHLTKERMLHICGTCVLDKTLEEKFKIDENGHYYNTRLDVEVFKRKSFCESRRLSRMSNVRETHVERTVNRNRNRNVNEVKNKAVFDFDVLWLLYPKKLGKHDAMRHFEAQVKTNEDYTNITKALENFLKSGQVTQGDPKFIPHGSTWFNNRWRDYITWSEETERKFDEHGVPLEWCTRKGNK